MLERFGIFKKPNKIIVTDTPKLALCNAAESLLYSALRKNTAFFIEGTPLIGKLNGKLAFLALENGDESSAFLPDNWYTPKDKRTIRRIERGFRQGKVNIDLPKKSRWTRIRTLNNAFVYGFTPDHEKITNPITKLLDKIEDYRKNPPTKIPEFIGQYRRTEYRSIVKENFG